MDLSKYFWVDPKVKRQTAIISWTPALTAPVALMRAHKCQNCEKTLGSGPAAIQ
jgi:hypothetical protein